MHAKTSLSLSKMLQANASAQIDKFDPVETNLDVCVCCNAVEP